MKRLSGLTRFLITMLLILAAVCTFIYTEHNSYLMVAIIWSTIILIWLVILVVSARARHRYEDKIITNTKEVSAKVLSVKTLKNKDKVLLLQVFDSGGDYTSSYVLHKPDSDLMDTLGSDQRIKVHINPDNHHDIIIHEAEQQSGRSRNTNWVGFIWIPIVIFSVGLPILLSILDIPDDQYQDTAYISNESGSGSIWIMRSSSPDKFAIKVYDPALNEKVKTIKESKDVDENGWPEYRIFQQNRKVFVVNHGDSPSIDIFDAVDFEKVSGTEEFVSDHPILEPGIATISFRSQYQDLTGEDVVEIVTIDGRMSYYNITLDTFYNTEDELSDHIKQAYKLKIEQQKFVFILSKVANSVDKYELYKAEPKNKRSLGTILDLAYNHNVNEESIDGSRNSAYRDCNITPLIKDKYFLRAELMYQDSTMVVVKHVTSLGENSEVELSCISSTGRLLFEVKESDFPNIEEIYDNSFSLFNNEDFECIRQHNQIIFLFGKHGAFCFNIGSGLMIWKLEP